MNYLRAFIVIAAVAVVSGTDTEIGPQVKSIFSDVKLVCKMNRDCSKRDTCEIPCKIQESQAPGKKGKLLTTTSFLDAEFEELWDKMQEEMKRLNEHQAELIAQQNDLLVEQRKLENANKDLERKQSELLARQEELEKENERLITLTPGSESDEELRKKVFALELKVKVLTEQQRKLASQQKRLVEQQNKLMHRQRKLEQENTNLRRRQERIEKLNLESGSTPRLEPEIAMKSVGSTPQTMDPIIESKFKSIKRELEQRIAQLTGQQQRLLTEQAKLINRQARLEEENEELREKQEELYEKQEELEKENQQLRTNISHTVTNPEIRQKKIKESGLCEIMYQEICFGLLGDGDDELTKNDAEENCKAYGGNLANIYSEEHYDMIKAYFIKKKIPSGVWLGMTYNPLNYKVSLTDGMIAPYLKWNFINPLSYSSYTAIYLYIDSDPESIYSGMVNLPPTRKYPFALCQFGVRSSDT